MKYIEELENGDCFVFKKDIYITNADFKSNGQRLCINLNSGINRWIAPNEIVEICPIYYIDKDANITPIKPTKKNV
jgi:hypothetical protein